MKVFLNNFMNENRHLERYDESTLNGILEPTMALVNETVGREAFRPQHALNASVTDAILVGVARRLQEKPVTDRTAVKAALDPVLEETSFADLYTVGQLTRKKSVHGSRRLASRCNPWTESCSDPANGFEVGLTDSWLTLEQQLMKSCEPNWHGIFASWFQV